ncbi:MAG: hypothetical protein HN576_00740 [Bacteriovoracaceae bacterium]|nr:hypothetical protein [Bacteriovoracaceae bacterium]
MTNVLVGNAYSQEGDSTNSKIIETVVNDPSIRLRCEILQNNKDKKLKNKKKLITLANKNLTLRRFAAYEKKVVKERLKIAYSKILDAIKQRNFDIEIMTEELIRKGCPSLNFDYITEEYVKKILFKGKKNIKRAKGLRKSKTDYSEENFLSKVNDRPSEKEINEMSGLLEDSKSKEDKFKAINHFGMGVFNYGQSYFEDVDGLDSLTNNRSVQLGFSASYMRETTLFSKKVMWTTYFAFGNESELEIEDSTGTTQSFDAHTNLTVSLSLRTAFKERVGVFGYVLSDQLTTLYNSDLSAASPASAVDTRNYSIIWTGIGIDTNFKAFNRVVIISAHLATTLVANNDVAASSTDDTESTTAFRVGFDLSARLLGKMWGDLKYQEDSYSGLSNLTSSRLTLGLSYHFF